MVGLPRTKSNNKGILAFIKNNPVTSMYAIMFTLTWSVMIPQALYSQGILSSPLPEPIEILTGWFPGIAAILVAAVVTGKAGVRELLSRFLIWRVGFRWYFSSVFLLAFLILGGIGLHVFYGGIMPVIPAAGTPFWQIALVFIVFVLLGVLINTEEIAWRGFALPRLQDRYGALAAALLITVPEVMLHLPLFWVESNPFFQTVGIYWFSAFSAGVVFIYVYTFNMTEGSLLIVTLLHASQNAWANLLSDNTVRPFQFTVVLIWVVTIGLVAVTRGRLGYQPEKIL